MNCELQLDTPRCTYVYMYMYTYTHTYTHTLHCLVEKNGLALLTDELRVASLRHFPTTSFPLPGCAVMQTFATQCIWVSHCPSLWCLRMGHCVLSGGDVFGSHNVTLRTFWITNLCWYSLKFINLDLDGEGLHQFVGTWRSTWNSSPPIFITKEILHLDPYSPSLVGSRTSPVMNLGIRSRDNDYPVTEHIPDHPPDITHHPTLLAYPVITRTSYHYLRVLNISFGWVTSASEAWRSRLTVLGAQL